jgi:hypothetical protein
LIFQDYAQEFLDDLATQFAHDNTDFAQRKSTIDRLPEATQIAALPFSARIKRITA